MSSEATWRKLLSNVSEIEVAEMKGTPSTNMVFDMDHDLFRTIVKSYTIYTRLANTEKALATKRKRREEALIELETAKDNIAVTQVEKEEIVRHEWKTIEEKKALKTEHAGLFRELKEERKKVTELTEALNNTESSTIANFKKKYDFQALIMPIFLEGFAHAKVKFAASFPDLDFSGIEAGGNTTTEEEQINEGEDNEELVEVEEQTESS